MRTKIYTTVSQSCNVNYMSSVHGHLGEGTGFLNYLQKFYILIDCQLGLSSIILTKEMCVLSWQVTLLLTYGNLLCIMFGEPYDVFIVSNRTLITNTQASVCASVV